MLMRSARADVLANAQQPPLHVAKDWGRQYIVAAYAGAPTTGPVVQGREQPPAQQEAQRFTGSGVEFLYM